MFALALLRTGLEAASPTLLHVYPSAGKIGQTTDVELIGDFETWPPQVWVSEKDIRLTFGKEKGKAQIGIDPGAAPGPKLIRCFNSEGSSAPVFFVASHLNQHRESEPNDSAMNPAEINGDAVVVNGRLSKRGDVDSFGVTLSQGQWLIVEAFAYRLRSSIDPLVQVLDPSGIKVAFNHDYDHLDPFVTYQATETGIHTIQIMGFDYPAKADIRFGGSKNAVYQLHVHSSPYVHHSYPFQVQHGTTRSVQRVGWNLTEQQRHYTVSADELDASIGERSIDAFSHELNTFRLASTEYPQHIASANEASSPFHLSIPSGISGRMPSASLSTAYEVLLEKDHWYHFELKTKAPIHHLHTWLELESADGKSLRRSYDTVTGLNPSIRWKATQSEMHTLRLGNLLDPAENEYYYHLTATEPAPTFKAQLSTDQFTIQPGSTNKVSIDLKRFNGHEAPLRLWFKNLPNTIQQSGGDVPAKETKVELQLITREDALPYLGEISLIATDLDEDLEQTVTASFLGSSVNNGVPGGYQHLLIEETASLWLTIPPSEPEAEKEADSQ